MKPIYSQDRIGVKSMKAVLKNMRKMFMLQAPIDSECSEFYIKKISS